MIGRAAAGERGAIAAEQVAVVALVAAVIGAIWAIAVPDRVEEAGAAAADCLFQVDAGACDLTAAEADRGGGDASTDRDGDDAPVVVPVGAGAQREADVHRQLQDEAAALRELADRDLADLADLLEGWADSDRRFVHVEVDLDDGTVRIAEVVRGDLDAAGHVALVIPGTGSDGGNFDTGTRANAQALGESLELVPGGDDVAVIACLCYAPPPGLVQAGSSRHADAGGADLARIVVGLPVGDAQVHALGHSYGSTALGRAVTRDDLALDSTISLGGPGFGSGVQRVEDLPDTAGQVWGVRHDLDPIDLAGVHGRNPDRGSFGAHRFDVGDDGIDRKPWKPYIVDAHSIYYQDAESLRNLALIVSGNAGEVTGYRGGRR